MQTDSDREWFVRHLRTALTSLYDPSVLRKSPLAELFGVAQQSQPVFALQDRLTGAIESFRPDDRTPQDSRTWRVYRILRRRYTEQLTQQEVASDLGLSIRQLQREEKLGHEVLADYLWNVYNLDVAVPSLVSTTSQVDDQEPLPDVDIPTHVQELEQLRIAVPIQMTALGEVIEEALEITGPLLASSRVTVKYVTQEGLPRLLLRPAILRQALIHLIGTVVGCVPCEQVDIQSEALSQQVCIHIQAMASDTASSLPQHQALVENLQMAEQLVRLCRGSLEMTKGATWKPSLCMAGGVVFAAKIILPLTEHVLVLVIDDNADTLQLYQRYLSDSRYRFISAQNAQQGLALAEALQPQIIVLDVMMPEKDGWTILGQLREHPKTRGVPIIVCTILPQEQLALALGAAAFLRKPINRTAFLSALDRQLNSPARESR